VDTRQWLTKNYTELLNITKKVVKNESEVDDVFQCVVEQVLLKDKKLDTIDDKQKLYYFIRVVKNNYYSKTSSYYYQYKKSSTHNLQFDETIYENIPVEPYKENLPTMEWVNEQLKDLDWFSRDLFLLWLDMGSLTAVSKQTTIPLNSVGRYIKDIKIILKERWQKLN
jgi:hypothetical protein